MTEPFLAIRGLAKAARILDKPEFAAAADRALEFIRANLWRPGPNGGSAMDPNQQLQA